MPQRKSKINNVPVDLKLERQLAETREMLSMARSEISQLRNKLSGNVINYETEKFNFQELFPGNFRHEETTRSSKSGHALQHSDRTNNTNSIGDIHGPESSETDSTSELSTERIEEPYICIDKSCDEATEEGRGGGALIERGEH